MKTKRPRATNQSFPLSSPSKTFLIFSTVVPPFILLGEAGRRQVGFRSRRHGRQMRDLIFLFWEEQREG